MYEEAVCSHPGHDLDDKISTMDRMYKTTVARCTQFPGNNALSLEAYVSDNSSRAINNALNLNYASPRNIQLDEPDVVNETVTEIHAQHFPVHSRDRGGDGKVKVRQSSQVYNLFLNAVERVTLSTVSTITNCKLRNIVVTSVTNTR